MQFCFKFHKTRLCTLFRKRKKPPQQTYRNRRHHIYQRMLFQKHCGNSCQERSYSCRHSVFTASTGRCSHRQKEAHRPDHVFRRTYIGIGIQTIQQCHPICQTIASAKYIRTEILTGRIQQKQKSGNAHCQNKISGVLPVSRIIPDQQPQMYPNYTEIPQEIGYEKSFHKWDPVIQRAPDRMKYPRGMKPFQQKISQTENRPEQQPAGILFGSRVAFSVHGISVLSAEFSF